MPQYFIDSTTGDNADTGLTMDLAWATLEYALEAGGLVAGDIVWVRRIHVEYAGLPASDILVAYSGTAKEPIKVIGCPRAAIPNTTITGADWTNGSNLVDNVAGITPTRTRHMGRFATAPDGHQYLLTAILVEFTVDGMAAGDEFTVGSKITNTTQTKYGQVWTFTDNGDTTGTLQCVVNSASAWLNNDNVTDADGGDAELSANAVNVGFLIDREYAGSTVTGINGKFQIEEDENYDLFQAIDDTAWIIKKADWNADADDLPCVDFKDQAFQLITESRNALWFANLEFRDSSDVNGVVYCYKSQSVILTGCLLYNDNNSPVIKMTRASVYSKRLIVEGSGAGITQKGVYLIDRVVSWLIDTAIYNCGDWGITFGSGFENIYLENVNVGVEIANDDDIYLIAGARLFGRDIKLGGTNGDILFGTIFGSEKVAIENYQKILKAHKIFTPQGEITKTAADGTGDSPNQRSGGAANIIELLYNSTDLQEPISEWTPDVFVHEFEVNMDLKGYRYYVQSMAGLTATQLWLECEYVATYDDGSEYVIKKVVSDEAISVRADQDDWTQYIEVTGIQSAVASKVRIKCYCNFYHATSKIYIDPRCAISWV